MKLENLKTWKLNKCPVAYKVSFKNLTPGLYTSNYGNYKIRSIKHYTQSLILI